jgi:hypothetical protein
MDVADEAILGQERLVGCQSSSKPWRTRRPS